MSKFRREPRYIVVKIKDLLGAGITPSEIDAFNAICDKASRHRVQRGAPPLECVVVEKDWRCYDTVWDMVENEHIENEAKRVAP